MKVSRYEELFQENTVMTIERLKLETGQPRESILRDLKQIGYYSSYNERGKYYTLHSIPEFDDIGLWKYQRAFFSVRRTVLDTATYLIGISDAGYTHDDLRRILGIDIQNTLLRLTATDRITRRLVGGQYVYFGIEKQGEQWERRSVMPVEPIVRKRIMIPNVRKDPDMDPTLIIDILVAALRGHDTAAAAHSYLYRMGSTATAHQVLAVFRHYDIGKKNSPSPK